MNSIIYYERISHTCMSFGKIRHILLYEIPLRLNPALPVSSFRQCRKNTVLLLLVILSERYLLQDLAYTSLALLTSLAVLRLLIQQ